MFKRDRAGFSYGAPGQHHAIAIIAARQEEILYRKPRISWYLRKAIAWESDTPLTQIAKDIRELYLGHDPPFHVTPFREFLIDQARDMEPVKQLRKHLMGSGISVKPTPIVEQDAEAPAVRRMDLYLRWKAAVDDGVFKVDATADPAWREHTLLLDAEKPWRSSDSDFLACATALAAWTIDTVESGYQPGYII